MMDTSSNGNLDQALPWVEQALRATGREVEPFEIACAEAADVGLLLLKLQRAHAGMGTPLLAVNDLLEKLATAASIPVAPILAWAGLDQKRPADDRFAAAWGRLASRLNLELRQALLHLRLTIAEEMGLEMMPAMSSSRGVTRHQSAMDECEEFLARETSRWDDEVLQRLRDSERALRENYQSVKQEQSRS